MTLNIIGPIQLIEKDISLVETFCDVCKKLNYTNNASLATMNWTEATWFAHLLDNEIVSLSGVQKFEVYEPNAYRIMYRGATLPGITNRLLNKEQAKHQIMFIREENPNANFYISVNVSSRTGVKSYRLSNLLHSGRGWPGSVLRDKILLYGSIQEIWQVE